MLNDSVAALPAAMSSSASVEVLPGMALTCTGMPSSSATSQGEVGEGEVAGGAAVDHRAGAELDLAAELLGVHAGVVAGEVHVDDDDHVRLPAGWPWPWRP